MHRHAKGYRPIRDCLPDVAMPNDPNALSAQFGSQSLGASTSPKIPSPRSQLSVCRRQGDVTGQEGGHHIFGNRILVTEGVTHFAGGRKSVKCHLVVACGRKLKQLRISSCDGGLEVDTHYNVCRVKCILSNLINRVRYAGDLMGDR